MTVTLLLNGTPKTENEANYRDGPSMTTSFRQIEANRRNALKSTGPKTDAGKKASRCNAVRHGSQPRQSLRR